jgi:hypothetical protein
MRTKSTVLAGGRCRCLMWCRRGLVGGGDGQWMALAGRRQCIVTGGGWWAVAMANGGRWRWPMDVVSAWAATQIEI